MGALAVAIVVTLLGAFGAGFGGFRATVELARSRRGRVARRVVALLAGLGGAEIATQLLELVRQLRADASNEFGSLTGTSRLDTINVVLAFRYVLFFGVLMIGLAALVGVGALRRYADDTA